MMIWFLQNIKYAYKSTTERKINLQYLLTKNKLEEID
jgi:hypothetical protein